MTFTEKVQRSAREVNKAKAGEAAGLGPTTISNYIAKGSVPRADIAFKIARALNVPLDWLVDDAQDWPPPRNEPQSLAAVPDSELMDEACRRLVNRAAQLGRELSAVEATDWPSVAAKLLATPVDHPLPELDYTIDRMVYVVDSALRKFREFDATRAAKERYSPAPDWDDFLHRVRDVQKMPAFDAVKRYMDLRQLAAAMQRHHMPAADRDLDRFRRELLAKLPSPASASQ